MSHDAPPLNVFSSNDIGLRDQLLNASVEPAIGGCKRKKHRARQLNIAMEWGPFVEVLPPKKKTWISMTMLEYQTGKNHRLSVDTSYFNNRCCSSMMFLHLLMYGGFHG